MKLIAFSLAASSCLRCVAAQQQQYFEQAPFATETFSEAESQQPINVAIIGAGAGGSSAAYHLRQFATDFALPVNITIFERNAYVGGRSTTVNVYDDPAETVELGASIFVEVNKILTSAVVEFNLSTAGFLSTTHQVPGAALGIWNGEEFVFTQTTESSWWDTAKLLWRFLTMYAAPQFPFASLTQVVQDVGLVPVVASTGEELLADNGITGAFGNEIVQAATRVNYAQNLKHIHGLEAMVCMAAENAMSVKGGNWQIFSRMIASSNATALLSTQVTDVEKHEDRSYSVKYRKLIDAPTTPDQSSSSRQRFDSVILASPLQSADLHLPPSLKTPPAAIPYVELHVTLFTSPYLLSPAFFKLAVDKTPPRMILTTLPGTEAAGKGSESVGSPGFFSISLLRAVTNPHTSGPEYLYKIFTPAPANHTFLSSLLGVRQQQQQRQHQPEQRRQSPASNSSIPGITWLHRKVWHSYPYEYPRNEFEAIKLDDDDDSDDDHGSLWYTSGIESFISTMETSALMGANVARLLVDDWLQKRGLRRYSVI